MKTILVKYINSEEWRSPSVFDLVALDVTLQQASTLITELGDLNWHQLKFGNDDSKVYTRTAALPFYKQKGSDYDIDEPSYEHVNSPEHYNNYSKEVIDMMVDIYGKEKVAIFCEINAFKYRMRMGTKPGQDVSRDLDKEKWYLDKKNELKG